MSICLLRSRQHAASKGSPVFNILLAYVKDLVAKSPARLVGYGSAIAVAGALKLADLLGVSLPTEVLDGVKAIAALVVIELIRRFVYSPNTTQNIAIRAAVTGDIDIGSPPKG